MFQIAATSVLAWRNNDVAAFDITNHHLPLQGRSISNYTDNIFRTVDFRTSIKHETILEEPGHKYAELPYTGNMMLVGYFQSEKYFAGHKEQIRKMFSPGNATKEYLTMKYGGYLTGNTTSIHIRRGDYLKFREIHPVCGEEYYKAAINHFHGNTRYLVFSDDPGWCLDTFKLDRFTVVEEEEDYIDMHLMSMCKNNIIANSSFSWWGAWLNNNPDKIIVAPKIWFGPAIKKDVDDLIPDGWLRL